MSATAMFDETKGPARMFSSVCIVLDNCSCDVNPRQMSSNQLRSVEIMRERVEW